MRVHRNAKTTPKMRQLIVDRAPRKAGRSGIAAALGMSVRTVAKWWRGRVRRRRWATARRGRIASRAALAAPLEAAIVAMRRTRATAWQISTALRCRDRR